MAHGASIYARRPLGRCFFGSCRSANQFWHNSNLIFEQNCAAIGSQFCGVLPAPFSHEFSIIRRIKLCPHAQKVTYTRLHNCARKLRRQLQHSTLNQQYIQFAEHKKNRWRAMSCRYACVRKLEENRTFWQFLCTLTLAHEFIRTK